MTVPADRLRPPAADRAPTAADTDRGPRRAAPGLAALLAAALVAACGGARIVAAGDVRLVNATGGALDLQAGDSRIASAVAADAASGYAEVEVGTRALSLRLPDGGADLARTSADVAKDAHYALLAYASGDAVASVLLGEDEAAPAAGSAKLRILNAASADAGALSAYLSPTACTGLGAANAVATGVTGPTPSAYATVGAADAGTSYHLCVTAAGDTSDLRLDAAPFVLAGKQVKTVVLAATSGGVLVNALAVEQRGTVTAHRNTRARLRLAADAAGGARVGASAAGATLAVDAASPAVGGYVAVTAGPLAADVRIGGAAVAVPALDAPPGADLTLLVAGSASQPRVVLLADDNRLSAAGPASTRLRLVHGVNGLAGTLSLSADLYPVASDVAFASASPPVNVASLAGASIQVVSPASAAPLYNTAAPASLRAGAYTLFMLGDAAAPVGVLRPDRLVAAAPAGTASGAGTGTGAGAAAR